jgi:hypothetical protein
MPSKKSRPEKYTVNQKAQNIGGNVTQTGRDFKGPTNFNLLTPVFFISLLAFGGLAWTINVGLNKGSSNQITEPSP